MFLTYGVIIDAYLNLKVKVTEAELEMCNLRATRYFQIILHVTILKGCNNIDIMLKRGRHQI